MAMDSGHSHAVIAAAMKKEGSSINDDILPLTLEEKLGQLVETIIMDHQLAVHDEQRRDQAAEFTRQHIRKIFDNPRVSDLERVIRKTVAADEARHILFFPNDEQAAYYPTLIAELPLGAPPDHPQRALQITYLSLLYLQHWKRWGFVSAFVFSGGLHSLCSLFVHKNLVVRMNAICTFVNITAHKEFDWFRFPRNSIELSLHRALVDLRDDPCFLSGLIANSWAPATPETAVNVELVEGKTFPGGCLICLELLAMWLSWVRKIHTPDGMLRLSKTLFKAIEGWGGERGEKGSEHSGGSRGWGNGPWEMDTPEKETEDTAEGSESAAVTRSGQSCDSVRGEPVPTATGVASFVVRGNDSHHLRAKTETSAVVDVQTKHKRTSNADNDSERQESTKEREQSEWEQVVKLSNTLVNDFGRLPFARENWEEVHAIPITGGGESDVGKGEDSYDASLNDLPGISDTGISTTTAVSNTNGTGHLADAGNTFGGRMDSLLSAVTKKAEELRAQGNDKFRTGNIDESLCAFSLALDVLKQAESHPSDTIGLTGSIGGAKIDQEGHGRKQEQVCSTLRGVLHRNRAAVLLRMFDRMAEAPGQVQNEVKSPKVKDSPEDFQEANLGIPSVTDGHVYIHRQKVVYTSSDKGTEGERVKVTSTQLLEQCEADCLRALEVDATDKKARFRLVRCRELQQQQQQQANRRAVTATTDAAYTVTDGRQLRKATVMAKILSRMGDSSSLDIDGSEEGRNKLGPFVCNTETNKSSTAAQNSSSTAAREPSDTRRVPERPHGSVGIDLVVNKGQAAEHPRGAEAVTAVAAVAAPNSVRCVPTAEPAGDQSEDKRDFAPWGGPELGDRHKQKAKQTKASRSRITNVNRNKTKNRPGSGQRGGNGRGVPSIIATSSSKRASGPRLRALRRELNTILAPIHRANTVHTKASTEIPTPAVAGSPSPNQDQQQKQIHGADDDIEQKDRRVWKFLSSLASVGVSLDEVFVDGIAEEELAGVTRGLKYACERQPRGTIYASRGAAGGANDSRDRRNPLEIFVELGRVKRAGLVLTMSSTADRENLRQVSAHCREHGWVRQNGHLSQCANNTTTAAAVAAATYDRQKALDVAIAALGLVA